MMQLLCNGVRLDLYDNASLQFVHTNPLFAFDKISCERTTQFKLPCTPINDGVLSLARIPAYSGAGMRQRFTAQLQDGTVVKDGYLYISEYDGKDYAAIFVTGELIGLQAIRNAGSIKDIWQPAGWIVWDVANTKDANTYAGQLSLAITRYKSNDAPCHPSFDLSDVMDGAYFAFSGRHISSYLRGIRIIPKEMPAVPQIGLLVSYAGTGAPASISEYPTDDADTLTSDTPVIGTDYTQTLLFYDRHNNEDNRFWKLRQFVAKQTLLVTFPDGFPDDYFLMSITPAQADPEFNVLSPYWFLGGYSFSCNLIDNTIDTSGTPLAGRTIEIPSGTPFILMSSNWVTFRPNAMGVPGIVYGFEDLSNVSYTYSFALTIEGTKLAPGDTVRALDILPDLSLVEIMKIYAYCTGKILNYDEANGVTFDDLNYSTWPEINLSDKLLKRSTVSRKFSDYVQHNRISFNSGLDVPTNQRISAEYIINNANLAEQKDIAVIPYSEGSIDTDDGYVVARFDAEDTEEHRLYADGIMKCGASAYGMRISLPTNSNLQDLCDASTQFKVEVEMNLMEYEAITPKTLLDIDNSLYVWTERSWQKNTAQFVLAKL